MPTRAKTKSAPRSNRASSPSTAKTAKLREYQKKRNFSVTSEPSGAAQTKSSVTALQFVIQKHDASHLHYDFRLELNGVLKSWAVPKGPSLDPARKALAIQVEDHPIEYGTFEGIIPHGQYGGGTVLLWDHGTWEPLDDPARAYEKGKLRFILHGEKLHGEWSLVRMHPRPGETKIHWLLMKTNDQYASTSRDILTDAAQSVKTGRSLAEIAGKPDHLWESNSSKKTKPAPSADKVQPLPNFSPQLAVLADHPPEGDDWLHEIKFDGYRLLAFINGADVRLITRNNQDWTDKFPTIAKTLARLKADATVIDGEIVVLDAKGHSDFQALQASFKDGKNASPIFYAFDLPFHNGVDLRNTPLIERKKALKTLLDESNLGSQIRFSDHVQGKGDSVIKKACGMSLEGIVSKLATAPYVSRRDPSWLKSKCDHRQEMVIVGFTDPQKSRQGFGSLLLGYYDDKKRLVYSGRVGTGFDSGMLRTMHKQLQALEQKETPLDLPPPPRERRAAHWVRPTLVAEIRFSNWTRDGSLRHPAFIALRSDKPADQVKREIPIHADEEAQHLAASLGDARPRAKKTTTAPLPTTAIQFTHLDKVLYRDKKISKQDLVDYYELVREWMLPHIINRPLTLLRCPGGTAAKCFFQRNWTETLPKALAHSPQGEGPDQHILVRDFDGLLSLVQINALEIHTWNCHQDDLEHPDQMVFDLDPDPAVPWKSVVTGATMLNKALQQLNLPTYLKTSGGKGLHLTIPIKPNVEWHAVKSFCEQVAKSLVQQSDLFVANMRKDLRHAKIYIDYQRNSQSATAIAPYSTRARPGAAVSMPIAWKELPALKSADQFTVDNAAKYLAQRKQDPWADFDASRVDLRRIAAQK